MSGLPIGQTSWIYLEVYSQLYLSQCVARKRLADHLSARRDGQAGKLSLSSGASTSCARKVRSSSREAGTRRRLGDGRGGPGGSPRRAARQSAPHLSGAHHPEPRTGLVIVEVHAEGAARTTHRPSV